MKKIVWASLLVFLFASRFVAAPVRAQTPVYYYDWSSTLKTDSSRVLGIATSSATPQDYARFDRYLVGGEWYPNNPFYFVKRFQENVQFFFIFDAKDKEEMRLQLAGQRLAEMQKMADQAQTEPVTIAAQNYEAIMEDIATNVDDAAENVNTEIAKHTIILHEVATKVSSGGEEAVEKALVASEKSTDVVADLTGRPAIPPDLIDRITALKAQGLLTPEEAAKLIAIKTRVEARQELRKYANEGVLPTADLLRMNEQLRVSFPDEFYRMHEIEKFKEMKKLESQRPDPTVQTKIQEFAKIYKPGDIVPADIRPYWGPIVRLEEVQNTFRPDLIDPTIFKNNPDDEKKFQEIVERYKPRQEDINFVNQYLTKNKTTVDQLPPEYQRMYRLGQTYGTQTSAPSATDKQPQKVSCPSNAHFVSLPHDQNGGYCIPNYTPRPEDQRSSEYQNTPCPSGYHRNYAGGACLRDYDQNTSGYLPSLTTTPGNYPSPFYSPSSSACSPGSNWVPEPINPRGGYCTQSNTPSLESQEAACRAGGGTCVSWVNGACGCERPGENRSGEGSRGCAMPQNGCGGNGRWWDYNSCACREPGSYPSACTYPSTGCGSNMYWDSSSCSCRSSSSSSGSSSGSGSGSYVPPPTQVSRETQDANCRSGGGTCNWNGDTCRCETSNSSSGSTPPSGYGSCSSGQYWNGSSCVTNEGSSSGGSSSGTPSREDQETACRSGGGTCVSWVNDACGCERPSDTSSQSAPTSAPPPTSAPEPSQ